jgi:hypothetical protein
MKALLALWLTAIAVLVWLAMPTHVSPLSFQQRWPASMQARPGFCYPSAGVRALCSVLLLHFRRGGHSIVHETHGNERQMMDVVVDRLRAHPEARHYAAAGEVYLALTQGLPLPINGAKQNNFQKAGCRS